MKKLLVAASLTAMISMPAMAADVALPRKAAPAYVEPVAQGWSGFYIGAFVGGARGNVVLTDIPTGATSTHDTVGALGGGTLGFNWQWGSWVLGVEADGAWTDISGTTRCPNVAFQCSSQMNWMVTARGRLGYAHGPILFYATGGGAWAEQRYGAEGLTAATAPFTGFTTRTVDGWVAGAGIEWQMIKAWPNLSMKVEWLHYDFDPGTNEPFLIGVGAPSNSVTGHHRGELVKLGLNYRFNWYSPVVASY
jgi:outer membrane immunogenic protein